MHVPESNAAANPPKLGAALRQRHVTMIAPGGIIGAGLFVGSSATLSTVGPAACVSYLVAGVVVLMVMRMLGEMALVVPGVGSFTEYARICVVVYLATALAQIRIRRRIEAAEPQRLTLKMWLFPWLSYAVVAAIVGVLVAMAADPALRPQLLASVASLAVASAAYGVAARCQRQDDASATGYLSPIGQHAMEGRQ